MYIIPTIRIRSTFEDAAKSLAEGAPAIHLSGEDEAALPDVIRGTRNLIVGEPGIGKTLLLKHINDQLLPDIQQRLLLRLKDSGVIEQATSFCDSLHGGPGALLLDALDEVGANHLPAVLQGLEGLASRYANVSIYLSSRWVFVRRYAPSFQAYRYVALLPFSTGQVRDYLRANGCTDSTIDTLIKRLSFGHQHLVIHTPRYLSYLVDFLKARGLAAAAIVSRNELFDHFIYSKLDLEDKKLNSDKKAIIKRILEKLALVMELCQTNSISQDGLMTFFDEVHSDLKQVALAQVPLATFYDCSLLKIGQKDLDTVEFDNTEFQEYLAAKEISRFADPHRAAFAFAADADANEIYPSWFNALTFLVDLVPSLLGRLVDFSGIRAKGLRVVDKDFFRFLGRIDASVIPKEVRRPLFTELLEYHQRTLQWLPHTLDPVLPSLFDAPLEDVLRQCVARVQTESGAARFVPLGNVAYLVGVLLEAGAPLDRVHWRQQLITFARDTNDNGVLQRNALFALGALGDPTVIGEVPDLTGSDDELIARQFVDMCVTLDPDHPASVEYAIESVRRGNSVGRPVLLALRRPSSIRRLLEVFATDATLRHELLEHASLHEADDKALVEHIEKALDEDGELAHVCEDAIVSSLDYDTGHDVEQSNLVLGLWNVLRTRPGFVRNIVERIARSENWKPAFYLGQGLFSTVVQPEDVADFVGAMAAAGRGDAILPILVRSKRTRGPAGEAVFEAGRSLLPDAYSEWEHRMEATAVEDKAQQETKSDKVARRFRLYLEPEPGKYSTNVFQFYNQNAEELAALITPEEKARLASLVTDSIFAHVDPIDRPLTITYEHAGGAITYATDGGVCLFGDAMKTAQLLGADIDVTRFRQRIINYLPFAYSEDVKVISQLAGGINAGELAGIVRVYRERTSDLWRHRTDNFVDLVEQHHLMEAAPVLKDFVTEPVCTPYVRERALTVLESLVPNPVFLSEIFSLYKDAGTAGERDLASTANGLLITQHADVAALQWRLDQIDARVAPFREPRGGHTVSGLEAEIHEMSFAKPLLSFGRSGHEDAYLKLLDRALQVWARGLEFHAYAQYMWTIVYGYFDNLKAGGSYQPLHRLERRIEELKGTEGANWLAGRMVQLRRAYLEFVGKPRNVSDAIKRYNDARHRQASGILTSADLYSHLRDALETDLRRWIEGEGAYKLILEGRVFDRKVQEYEKLIQKTIKAQIENVLLRRGLRVEVLRESQLLDDTRTDFLVRHGFAGPIVLEVKLTSHSDAKATDITVTDSYKSMVRYMDGYGAPHGLLVAIANEEPTRLQKLTEAFQRIPNVGVIGFDLTKDGEPHPGP